MNGLIFADLAVVLLCLGAAASMWAEDSDGHRPENFDEEQELRVMACMLWG